MKPILLFGYDQYYPSGGFDDFISDHDTEDEARSAMEKHKAEHYPCDYYCVVDISGDKHSEKYLN